MSFLKKVHNDGIIIQLKELLEDYPEVLSYEMNNTDYPSRKIGKGNPYHECTGCSKTNVQITSEGHSKKCVWKIAKKSFDYLYYQLNKWEKENLEFILQELSY